MFFKLTVFFLLLCIASSYYFFARLDPTVLPEYQSLMRESLEIRSTSAFERQPAHQVRKEVQKDIWTMNNHTRLHYRLKALGSELTILQKKGKIDLREKLENIACSLQEEIEDNGQQVRYLFAQEGTYFFPSHRFTTEEADLYFFTLPGDQLPNSWPQESPFLRGKARDVVFSASAGLPSFNAYHLSAELDQEIP